MRRGKRDSNFSASEESSSSSFTGGVFFEDADGGGNGNGVGDAGRTDSEGMLLVGWRLVLFGEVAEADTREPVGEMEESNVGGMVGRKEESDAGGTVGGIEGTGIFVR